MKIRSLALAGLFAVPAIASAQFATAVVGYNSGTGFAAGFTNPAAALGAPATGSAVTPFAPPFSKSQMVSIGTNGSLTLQFDPPIIKNPANPFGVDFQIFGNTFFSITNGNFSGGGITSGALGGNNTGVTRVEVSADGTNWFTLNPALTSTADTIFPTDGIGNPLIPVNPALTANDFGGLNLTGIRALYAGAAGGTGYELAWAQDTNGNFINLPIARFVRIDVLSNKSEVDAVATVRGSANAIADDFVNNPLQNGWQIFGDTNLFRWNATNQDLEVTWDSAQTNSFFYRPLGTTLARDDAFSLAFDLQLNDVTAFNYGSEIAVSLLNFANATNKNFNRSTGSDSPNLVEFTYFPDTGYGATVWPVFSDRNSAFNFSGASDYKVYAPVLNDWYHIVMTYTPSNQTMVTTMTNFEQTTGITVVDPLAASFTDFRVDTLSISSYGDDGFGDSVLAHGAVKNILVSFPFSPVQNLAGKLSGGQWQAQFLSRSNWVYTLERSADLISWSPAATAISTSNTSMTISDFAPPTDKSFYRVRADRP